MTNKTKNGKKQEKRNDDRKTTPEKNPFGNPGLLDGFPLPERQSGTEVNGATAKSDEIERDSENERNKSSDDKEKLLKLLEDGEHEFSLDSVLDNLQSSWESMGAVKDSIELTVKNFNNRLNLLAKLMTSIQEKTCAPLEIKEEQNEETNGVQELKDEISKLDEKLSDLKGITQKALETIDQKFELLTEFELLTYPRESEQALKNALSTRIIEHADGDVNED